ncbi:MmyB family transcriptional regulator [Winogradskya humida]|uniref:MmyB-like transcription regulator ligand binding domain-containing protein n=1 Tax=Winogradskya humida TaxID=113566 RepID=A0ABQ4A216_9ACTN|nr:helix-turn-helix domain-containing protein [Actinoplanes humidus]GIE24899.1 hypothetical protein Ahu01nite_080010 [Actinoplanes humidus]
MTPETELPATQSPTTDLSEQLAQLTRSWRERLEPPAQSTRPHTRRRTDIVTQQQFANMIGYTVGWYRELELGKRAAYSDHFLESVATAYHLNDGEKTLFYWLAAGHEPPAPSDPTDVSPTDTLQLIVNEQPWPAFVYTEAWDLVSINRHMRTWFPWARPGANVMHWIFTAEEARTHLYRWKEDWAPVMISRCAWPSPGPPKMSGSSS